MYYYPQMQRNADIRIPQLAWLITFVASLIADIRGDFPNFAWWVIAYMFCVVVGVFIVVGSDSTHTYHVSVSDPFGPMSCISLYPEGRWIPGCRSGIHAIHHQRLGILFGWRQRSFSSWLHFALYGHGKYISQPRFRPDADNIPDCMDLLLWLDPPSYPSRLYRFFRFTQRTTRINTQQSAHISSLRQRQPRNNAHELSRTPNVHIRTAQWL